MKKKQDFDIQRIYYNKEACTNCKYSQEMLFNQISSCHYLRWNFSIKNAEKIHMNMIMYVLMLKDSPL